MGDGHGPDGGGTAARAARKGAVARPTQARGPAGGGRVTISSGITGAQCDALSRCDFTPDSCGDGDQQGVCCARNANGFDCTAVVSGCDGKTHMSACAARQEGLDVMDSLSCIARQRWHRRALREGRPLRRGYKCCAGGAFVTPTARCHVPTNGACPAFP